MTSRAQHAGPRKNRPRGVPSQGSAAHRSAAKVAGAVVCGDCGLVQQAGAWSVAKATTAKLTKRICPACQRVRDGEPAGTLLVPAALGGRSDTLIRLIRNVEAAEKAGHPLERVMGIEQSDGRLVVTTTGLHLARKLSHELAKQLHRRPRMRYAHDEDTVHVEWADAAEGRAPSSAVVARKRRR